jgi:hypothetical protein
MPDIARDMVFDMEGDLNHIDLLAQTIRRLAEDLPLADPVREPIEYLSSIISDKARGLEEQRCRAARACGPEEGSP